MKLYIKNMVCNRCIKSVSNILKENKIDYNTILLGEVDLPKELTSEQKEKISTVLQQEGFELIDNKKTRIIEKIKHLILERIGKDPDDINDNLSDHLTDQLHLDYPYLSNLFSSIEGITIEKFLIAKKIEKAKELLVYDELSLSEIAFRLGYSSVQHLSNQFKKITGLTPSHFKTIGAERRNPL